MAVGDLVIVGMVGDAFGTAFWSCAIQAPRIRASRLLMAA
jgi:hypothetical protein